MKLVDGGQLVVGDREYKPIENGAIEGTEVGGDTVNPGEWENVLGLDPY